MIITNPVRRRHAAVLARSGCAVSALAFGLGLVGALTTDIAPAAAAEAGVARIIHPNDGISEDRGQPITSGNADTEFSIGTPTGAACTGDTIEGNYVVYGYLVAGAFDPDDLTFNSEGPVGLTIDATDNFKAPLYDTIGNPYAAAGTPKADTAGGPGLLPNIPTFELAPLTDPTLTLKSGAYNIGIACWRLGGGGVTATLDRFWNTRIQLTFDGTKNDASRITFVAPITTTTAIDADPDDTAEEGETVELSALLTPNNAAGTVTFKDGTTALGAAVNVQNGRAELDVDTLDVGDHTLTAAFTPAAGGTFAASTSAELDYTITAAGATTSSSSTSTTRSNGSSTTSTTQAGGAATSSSTTATTAAAGGGPRTGSSGDLARTGFSFSYTVWGLLAIALGRMAMLLGRPTRVKGLPPT